MLKCASVYTCEVDDADIALEEIKAQLEDKLTLNGNPGNTVGVVMCHPDFIETGTLRHVCENLPFDIAGVTTAAQAVNDNIGGMILTIFVMTSDDVWFRTGITQNANDGAEESIKAALMNATADTSESPKLALIFPPFDPGVYRSEFIGAWRDILPNTPLFGTFSIDDSIAFERSETIYNGADYRTEMPFILCYGAINPRFLIGVVPSDNGIPNRGIITKSDGPYVQEIDHMNAYEYFKSLAFLGELSIVDNLFLFPLMVNFTARDDYDGVPVVRVQSGFKEDGTAIFSGDMDEGSSFSFISFKPGDIISNTARKIKEINAMDDVSGVLIFSCICHRVMLLGIDPLKELRTARDTINPEIPFLMGYSGGEICPTSIRNGVPTNRFHTYSLVILAI